jgi:hypothetical protein
VVVDQQSLQRVNKLRKIARYVPFVILLANGISFCLAQYGFYFYDHWWIEQITGHGILTSLYMAFFAFLHRHCIYTLISILALIALNILNIAHYFISFDYYYLYSGIIIYSGIILAVIKWKQANNF